MTSDNKRTTKCVAVREWTPIVGRWRFRKGTATYLGPERRAKYPYGICAAKNRFNDGTATVTITRSEGTSGRLMTHFRSATSPYLTLGLFGYGNAYVISDFQPALGWTGLALAGSAEVLSSDASYAVEAQVSGRHLALIVKGVKVVEHFLESPMPAGQLGLFAWGQKPVHFCEMSYVPRAPRAFVVMQFSSPYRRVYREVIQPAAADAGIEAYKVEDVFGPGAILDDIARGITDCRAVVAEVSPRNANVFYELGFAHGVKKPTILVARRGRKLPFDITVYRCLFYNDTAQGRRKARAALSKHLVAVLGSDMA